MKRRIMMVCLLAGLLFTCSLSFGQKLTVLDMLKLSKIDDDEFDTYVTKKGYKLYKKERDARYSGSPMVTTYAYRQDGYTLSAEYFITDVIFDNGIAQLTYQTLHRTDYLEFKSQLKANGYKYVSSETKEGGTISLNYVKGEDYFELNSGQGRNGLGEQMTLYSIMYMYVVPQE